VVRFAHGAGEYEALRCGVDGHCQVIGQSLVEFGRHRAAPNRAVSSWYRLLHAVDRACGRESRNIETGHLESTAWQRSVHKTAISVPRDRHLEILPPVGLIRFALEIVYIDSPIREQIGDDD
jgi:hypothetical protein